MDTEKVEVDDFMENFTPVLGVEYVTKKNGFNFNIVTVSDSYFVGEYTSDTHLGKSFYKARKSSVLPYHSYLKYKNDFKLNDEYSKILSCTLSTSVEDDLNVEVFFHKCIIAGGNPQSIANILLNDLSRILRLEGVGITSCKITPLHLAKLANMLDDNIISSKSSKTILERMFIDNECPEAIAEELRLLTHTDLNELTSIIDVIVSNNPDQVSAYKNGKIGLLGYFIGKILKENASYDPGIVKNELMTALEKV